MAEEPQQMDIEAPAPAEVPKVHTPGEDSGLTTYPVALATQEAILEDQQLFTSMLQDLNAKLQNAQPKKYRPSKYRLPTVAGTTLNLHQLYQEVTKRGGAIAVTADNKWSDAVATFKFTNKYNLSAIRKIYSSILWHFEQVYQHKAAGQKLLEPPELPASAAADSATADGVSTRPSRNRRGASLAAIIAADNADTDDDGDAVATTPAKAAGKKDEAASASGAKKDGPENGKAAATGEGKAGGRQPQQRKQQQQPAPPQRAGSGTLAAPGKTPELVGFLKAGKGRKDLTGQLVTGKVDAKFDCGYFVTLTIAGQSFNGILYCPTAVAAAAATGAAAQAAAAGKAAAGGVKKDGAANGGVGVKREASVGADGDGGRGGKRRRSQQMPDSASKPKAAKTAFNYFAADQWPVVKAELGSNAIPQEISRAVGEKWNRATDAERQPYITKANGDRSRFEHEMQGWKAGLESPSAAAEAVDAEAAAGVAGTPGKPPIGKGLFTAGGLGLADAMEVDSAVAAGGDAAAGQQQPKPAKLKFKLGAMKPADSQSPAPESAAAAAVDPAAAEAAAVSTPKAADSGSGGTPAALVEEAARMVASVAPTAPAAAAGDAVPAADQAVVAVGVPVVEAAAAVVEAADAAAADLIRAVVAAAPTEQQ